MAVSLAELTDLGLRAQSLMSDKPLVEGLIGMFGRCSDEREVI